MHSSTLDALVDRYAAVSEANHRRLAALANVLAGFASREIEVMLLKGADLLLRCYGLKGTRPLADIDLLARERDLPAIDRWLRASGFTPLIDGNPAYACADTGLILDITTTIWYLDEAALDNLWRRAQVQPIGRAQALVMPDEDLLIHLTAYGVVHRGHLSDSFRQDLSLLTRRVPLDWERLVKDARSRHLAMPLFHAFSLVRTTRPEIRIPDWVTQQLAPRLRHERRLLWLLRKVVTGEPIPEVGHLLLVLSQPSGKRWAWLRQVLFPSRAFLEYRYGAEAARQPRLARIRRWLRLMRSAAILATRVIARLSQRTAQTTGRADSLDTEPPPATISAAGLSGLIPLSLLGDRVTFRVASKSMEPTLRVGDVLELGPAAPLRVGDLVVYEDGDRLVCHRLRSRNENGNLLVSGDADPSSTELVAASRVKGTVASVTPRIASRAYWRHLIRQYARRMLLSRIGGIAIVPLRRFLTVTICTRAPIRSFELLHPISRMRGLARQALGRHLRDAGADRRPLSIRVSFGSIVLGTLDCASGHIEVGVVGHRLGVDRFLFDITDRPSWRSLRPSRGTAAADASNLQ